MQSKNTLGHDGHRERVLKKFLQYGGDVFADYELLEFIAQYIKAPFPPKIRFIPLTKS